MRLLEGRRASGPSTRARPAGRAPQRNHVNPHGVSTCVDPRGFVSVQFSRNRCRPAADSQSLSGRFRSQELFSGPPGGWHPQDRFRLFSGFAFWKERARASPGEVEDTERAAGCQALSREKSEKVPLALCGRVGRAGPSWPSLRRIRIRRHPHPSAGQGVPPPHVPSRKVAPRVASSAGGINPTKVGFRRDPRRTLTPGRGVAGRRRVSPRRGASRGSRRRVGARRRGSWRRGSPRRRP